MFLSSISYADHLDLHSFPTRRSSDLIREENWIQRSVALSRESNEKIVNLSIQHLKDKKELTNNPHKIIAVACSIDRKSTRLNSSHVAISYAVFCLKKKK